MARDEPGLTGTARNVVRIGTAGALIDRLVKHYNDDDLQGVMIVSKLKDCTFEIEWTNSIGFCERIGLAECLKQDMMIKASCPFEQED